MLGIPLRNLALAGERARTPGGSQMSVKPAPQGYNTVTPWIISRDTVQLIRGACYVCADSNSRSGR
ncbi:hypothetical protein ACFU93_27205 [Streptomyces sp. NPDC057611]|uniref:hypothetical protein n=1 Tax=Streptomyces sp. NPDC057611 TaxID=3346182 RepID=UPI0036A8BFAC